MIEYPRATNQRPPRVRIVGVGGAGCRVLERLLADHVEGASFIAMNSDAQLLGASSAPEKVQLGARGVGAGGDPDVGYTATDESAAIIRESLEGAQLVILCAGLGGGTGTGGVALIANIARQCGAVVAALVTLPFSFEGKRRTQQADGALSDLLQQAQLVVCFENDRMSELATVNDPAHQAFAMADKILAQTIRAISALATTRGVLNVGLDELSTVLRRTDARCLFGFGESDSESRGVDAIERALRSPLMKRGELLADTREVLVHVVASPDLTVVELGIIMEQVHRHVSEKTRVHLGVASDDRMGRRLSVSILSALGTDVADAVPKPVRPSIPQAMAQPVFESAPDSELFPETDTASSVPGAAQRDGKKEKVEQMQFEPVNRGRFEKSEPTMVDGHDFDVPTFLRKGLRLK
jgi:cell division protein FtsZ